MHFLGFKQSHELPAYIRHLDVCTLAHSMCEAMRYAQQERRTRKDGSVAIRARVVLNLRMIPKQEAGDP